MSSPAQKMEDNQQDLITTHGPVMRSVSRSESDTSLKEKNLNADHAMTTDVYHDKELALVQQDAEEVDADRLRREMIYQKLRPFILGGLAALILGWWISATVLKATRHRWSVPCIVLHFANVTNNKSRTTGFLKPS